jgi:hypothetical protein
METRLEAIATIVAELAKVDHDKTRLQEALVCAERPMAYQLEAQVESLSTIAFWTEMAAFKRAEAQGTDKILWRAIEGVLERMAHVLDKSIMATMHHNNMAERQYHQSGR